MKTLTLILLATSVLRAHAWAREANSDEAKSFCQAVDIYQKSAPQPGLIEMADCAEVPPVVLFSNGATTMTARETIHLSDGQLDSTDCTVSLSAHDSIDARSMKCELVP